MPVPSVQPQNALLRPPPLTLEAADGHLADKPTADATVSNLLLRVT